MGSLIANYDRVGVAVGSNIRERSSRSVEILAAAGKCLRCQIAVHGVRLVRRHREDIAKTATRVAKVGTEGRESQCLLNLLAGFPRRR